YGNVVGSRGSVVPVFLRQRQTGVVTITDERMTRFWLSLDQGVRFTIGCIERMLGGEVFVPKIPSMKVVDLAKAIAPDCRIEHVGIRPGEKLHEVLLSEDEARHAVELDDMYVVEPAEALWFGHGWRQQGAPLPPDFRYASDSNPNWMTLDEIRSIVDQSRDLRTEA
ncbi:MAG: polysaccharide biosynthesis protein, partial [Anaerolineales bacterium]|nr:polysaccharide biosynthesis protein [Anaerolineales bacterium]